MKKFKFVFENLIFKKEKELKSIQQEAQPLIKNYNFSKKTYLASQKQIKNYILFFYQENKYNAFTSISHFKNNAEKTSRLVQKWKKKLEPWKKKILDKNIEIKILEKIKDRKREEWKKLKDKKEQMVLEENYNFYLKHKI